MSHLVAGLRQARTEHCGAGVAVTAGPRVHSVPETTCQCPESLLLSYTLCPLSVSETEQKREQTSSITLVTSSCNDNTLVYIGFK